MKNGNCKLKFWNENDCENEPLIMEIWKFDHPRLRSSLIIDQASTLEILLHRLYCTRTFFRLAINTNMQLMFINTRVVLYFINSRVLGANEDSRSAR